MESGINKLRIVWICRFMNGRIQEKLHVKNTVGELGPWISLGIEEIRKRNDIELFVIAPFYMLLRSATIQEKNVTYHFIKTGMPFLRREWPRFFSLELWTDFYFFNRKVKKLVHKIGPHLINLHGAENANYSSSVLHLNNYPILITIQGFISLDSLRFNHHPYIKKRLEVEKKILCNYRYFGVEASSIEKYIRTFNPDAIMYWFHFPFAKSEISENPPKEYDLAYFARITKGKGIEDLLQAVAIVRNRIPGIKLCIIGKGDEPYIEYIHQLIRELHLTDNIIFKGFFPTQIDSHREVLKARISVLPTHNDTIPGTIVECMLLGVPVISYSTGGIPDLNKESENIKLVEPGNINKLAEAIIELLGSATRQNDLAQRAREFATIEFDNARSVDMMIQAYHDVIKKFNHEN